MGIMGLTVGALLLLMKDPIRGQWDKVKSKVEKKAGAEQNKSTLKKKPQGVKELCKNLNILFKNPVCSNIFIA